MWKPYAAATYFFLGSQEDITGELKTQKAHVMGFLASACKDHKKV